LHPAFRAGYTCPEKDACDAMRLRTERQAFEAFVAEFETLWPRIVQTQKK
jgi:hypothetical protein